MKRQLFPLPVLLITLSACMTGSLVMAEIYKEIDKDGNVVYTDVPGKAKQKPVDVTPMTTYKSRPVTGAASAAKTKKAEKKTTTTYSTLQVTSPAADAVIRANNGVISISLQSQPGLDTKAGHHYVILIDGQQRKTSTASSITVDNVDRGTHSIGAEIRDEGDQVMVSASPVQITVLRASVLKPANR
jgi:hypothetical protein